MEDGGYELGYFYPAHVVIEEERILSERARRRAEQTVRQKPDAIGQHKPRLRVITLEEFRALRRSGVGGSAGAGRQVLQVSDYSGLP